MALFQPPDTGTNLVIFSDDSILHSGKLAAQKHIQLCAEYAAKYKVFLVSTLIAYSDKLCLCLFSDEGKLVCCQGAIQLSAAMRGMFVTVDAIQVSHTEIGNIALCVDADISHSHTVRAAALKGADIIVSIQHIDPVDATSEKLMYSVWNAAQTNNLYVINFTSGGCCVTCPVPLTRSHDGYLIQRTNIVPAHFGLNLARLDNVREKFNLLEKLNTDIIKRYSDDLER